MKAGIEEVLLKSTIEMIEALQVSDFEDKEDVVQIIDWDQLQRVRLNLMAARDKIKDLD